MLLLDTPIQVVPQAVRQVGLREEVLDKDYYLLADGTWFLRTGLIYGLILTEEGEEIQMATMRSVGL